MYCDSDDNNEILLPVINTFYTCQADVDTKMTEHEIRKPKHMWTDDDLEPVQMMDTEKRKVIAMMLVILEQMSRKFVYSRRMKDLRELEAQHEATVLESATDDQKLRMHGEFKAICSANETQLWSMELSDQQAESLRFVTEMHVRFSEKDKISRQCSDDEGCLYTNLREVEWNFHHFNSSKFDSRLHNSNVNV